MRMNSVMIKQTLTQFDAQAIPENHPVLPQLKGLFGDHTFFLDGKGLNIVEPMEPMEEGAETSAETGKVVNLANWSENDPQKLAPHEPEPTEVVVVLATKQ
jgi:hypothetical protein